ncbi:hypothetical protein STXM2123_1130 [Streptomyces sp. F-3]|nr:hypothetical protein STXM2123_1130 [Streptomyces sp. F-3]
MCGGPGGDGRARRLGRPARGSTGHPWIRRRARRRSTQVWGV